MKTQFLNSFLIPIFDMSTISSQATPFNTQIERARQNILESLSSMDKVQLAHLKKRIDRLRQLAWERINNMKESDLKALSKRLEKDVKTPIKLLYRRDLDGNTLLHLQVKNWSQSRVDELLKMGSPVFVKNKAKNVKSDSKHPAKKQKNSNNFEGETPIEMFMKSKYRSRQFCFKFSNEEFLKGMRRTRISKYFPRDGDHYPYQVDNFYNSEFRVYPGRYVTEDLNLEFVSKHHGTCRILDSYSKDSALSLHDIFTYISTSRTEQSTRNSSNYVIANLGFIVSSGPHGIEQPTHNLQFITIPINHPEYEVYTPEAVKGREEHGEVCLFNYLMNENWLTKIVDQLKDQHGIGEGYKIYAAILDLYTKREMCEKCEEVTYRLQAGPNDPMKPPETVDPNPPPQDSREQFLPLLERILESRNYQLPKTKRAPHLFSPLEYRLHMVTRVSASLEWIDTTGNPVKYDKVPFDPSYQGAYYPKFSTTSLSSRNIKDFTNSVILHRPPIDSFTDQQMKSFEDDSYVQMCKQQQTLFVNPPRSKKPELIRRKEPLKS